jgi:hypothetical protein
MARRRSRPLGVPIILMKGTAYVAAACRLASGRSIGDLDIMVPKESLDAVQTALLARGWEWVKEDSYDDLYYRRWMHELPPLIHRERDRMIDVHHTILPLTARPTPDAASMIEESGVWRTASGSCRRRTWCSTRSRICCADGDLAGGLRNLWDIDRLLREFAEKPDFWEKLGERARLHQLQSEAARALRLAEKLYGTPVERKLAARRTHGPPVRAAAAGPQRLGASRRKRTRFAFYVRSHLLRMPPLMLARHLWVKARR